MAMVTDPMTGKMTYVPDYGLTPTQEEEAAKNNPVTPLAPESNQDTPPLGPTATPPVATQPEPTIVRPTVVPMTETQTQITSTPGYKPSKEAMDVLEKAQQAQRTAAEAAAAVERERAEFAAFDAMQKRVLLEDQAAKEDAKTSAESDLMASEMGKVVEATKKTDDWKLDPNRIMNQSAWTKIGAAMAITLGGIGAALTGGPNVALGIIESAIDRDIDAQKAEYNKMKGKTEELRSNYAMMRQKLGDDRLAREAARLRAIQALDSQLAERQAKFAGKEAEAKIQQVRAGLAAQEADTKLKLEEAARTKSSITTQSITKDVDLNKMSKEQLDAAKDIRGEYNAAVKDYKSDRDIADKIDTHLPGAIRGNAESINALNYMVARYFSGPGVLSDSDLKNASVNRSMFDSIGSKISKGLTGSLTKEEEKAFGRLAKVIRGKANEGVAKVTKDFLQLSKNTGINPELVIINKEDREGKKEEKSVTTQMKERK